jgi:uroporphyrinogen-III synthase
MVDLGRRVIAFLEGRRSAELAHLIERHNGIALPAPCLREVHSPDSALLQASIERILEVELDAAIFLTGVGTSTIFDAAARMGRELDLRERLESATVVARGPKPTAVLRRLGVRIDLTAPPPNTTNEVLAILDGLDLADRHVAVQLYGEPNPHLSQALAERGAVVLELAPYVWDRPIDPTPVLRLLDALERESIDALLVTSQAQVENLFHVAREHGRRPALERVALGAQGPVAEAALERHGLHVDFRPKHAHMGALVLSAAEFFASEGVLN